MNFECLTPFSSHLKRVPLGCTQTILPAVPAVPARYSGLHLHQAKKRVAKREDVSMRKLKRRKSEGKMLSTHLHPMETGALMSLTHIPRALKEDRLYGNILQYEEM